MLQVLVRGVTRVTGAKILAVEVRQRAPCRSTVVEEATLRRGRRGAAEDQTSQGAAEDQPKMTRQGRAGHLLGRYRQRGVSSAARHANDPRDVHLFEHHPNHLFPNLPTKSRCPT